MGKHSPGYGGVNWSNAITREWGQETDFGPGYPWYGWMADTTNNRLRIVGTNAYVIQNMFAESGNWEVDDAFADSVWVFKLTYNTCGFVGPISMNWP